MHPSLDGGYTKYLSSIVKKVNSGPVFHRHIYPIDGFQMPIKCPTFRGQVCTVYTSSLSPL